MTTSLAAVQLPRNSLATPWRRRTSSISDLSGMDCPIYLLAETHTSLIAVIRVLSSASCGVNLTLCSRLKNWGCITFAEQLKYEAAWQPWQQCLTKGSWEYWKMVWLQAMKSVLWDLCFRNTHIHTHMRVKAYVPLSFHWLTVFPQVRLLSVWQGSRKSWHSIRILITHAGTSWQVSRVKEIEHILACGIAVTNVTSTRPGLWDKDICAPVIRWYYLKTESTSTAVPAVQPIKSLLFGSQYWKIKVYGKLTWSGCLDGICQSILEFACVM